MLIRHDQEPDALEAMSKSIADLLVVFALAGYAVLGEAIRIRQKWEVQTAATNGRDIFYNPLFWKWMPYEERVFVLLHEFLHIFYNHVGRVGGRDPEKWNRAIDIFVNVECCVILGNNTTIPKYAIHPPSWYRHGEMTVEEVYNRLKDDEGQAPQPYEGGGELSDGTDLLEPIQGESREEKKEWIERLRSDLAAAEQINEQAGHEDKIPTGMRSRLQKIGRGVVPMDRLLRGTIQGMLGFSQVNWGRPNRKASWSYTTGGKAFALPTYQAMKERLLLILVDVSASVSQDRLNQFANNIENAAKRATKTVVVTFDQFVRERYETERPGEILRNIKLLMGAHGFTDARPAFAIAEEVEPSAIACLTDGHIALPDEPFHQTVFVRPPEPEGRALPWGKEFVMEELF